VLVFVGVFVGVVVTDAVGVGVGFGTLGGNTLSTICPISGLK
jgi:hypothetical protein